MFHVALVEPEIPPNTGNIIRLCANTGVQLHLVHPLGFETDDKRLRRAGLDYHEFASVIHHDNFEAFWSATSEYRRYAMTTKGSRSLYAFEFLANDMFVFGSETRGLSDQQRALFDEDFRLRIPMKTNSRSMNLSNATAVVVYEALRQQGFTELS